MAYQLQEYPVMFGPQPPAHVGVLLTVATIEDRTVGTHGSSPCSVSRLGIFRDIGCSIA